MMEEKSDEALHVEEKKTMQCLLLDLPNKCFNFTTCRMPKLTPKDGGKKVVIQVYLSGLCRTDQYIMEGKYPPSLTARILGHEITGTIFEVAEDEKVFKKGDMVVVNPNVPPCGKCNECNEDRKALCLQSGRKYSVGYSVNGGFAEYCKVRSDCVIKLMDHLKCLDQLDCAVLIEPLSCITYALDKIPSPVAVGQRVLVIGAGINGLLWCAVLHHMGHRRSNVCVLEKSVMTYENFYKYSSVTGFPVLYWEELPVWYTYPESRQFDVLIDTSGDAEAVSSAFPLLRKNGVLVIFGASDPSNPMKISPFEAHRKEVTIVGTSSNTHASFQKALNLLRDMDGRLLSMTALNMKMYGLDDYEMALRDLHEEKYTKIIFDCRLGFSSLAKNYNDYIDSLLKNPSTL